MTEFLTVTNEAPIGRNRHTVQVAPITPSAETMRNIEAIGNTFAGSVELQKRAKAKAWLRDCNFLTNEFNAARIEKRAAAPMFASVAARFDGESPWRIGFGTFRLQGEWGTVLPIGETFGVASLGEVAR